MRLSVKALWSPCSPDLVEGNGRTGVGVTWTGAPGLLWALSTVSEIFNLVSTQLRPLPLWLLILFPLSLSLSLSLCILLSNLNVKKVQLLSS